MRKTTGFTLIEMLIVLAIIGILAAVAFPAYQDYQDAMVEKQASMDAPLTLREATSVVRSTYTAVDNTLGGMVNIIVTDAGDFVSTDMVVRDINITNSDEIYRLANRNIGKVCTASFVDYTRDHTDYLHIVDMSCGQSVGGY